MTEWGRVMNGGSMCDRRAFSVFKVARLESHSPPACFIPLSLFSSFSPIHIRKPIPHKEMVHRHFF